MRVGVFDYLAIHLQHQPQDTMRGGMLRTKIEGIVSYFRHRRLPRPAHPGYSDYHP